MTDKNKVFLKILDARDSSINELQKCLEEKEVVIQNLKESHNKLQEKYDFRFRYWKYLIVPIERLFLHFKKVWGIFTPKLGKLQQHAPKNLCLPAHYTKNKQIDYHPKISIVTPSFRQGAFIERTLKSVFEQSYPNLEYFVQDGNSEDETKEILEKYSDQLTGWESKRDNGQTHAINLGFAKTTGEIMAWINSDDIVLPGTLFYVADYFNHHPEVDVVYGNRIQIDIHDKKIGQWILPKHDNNVLSWTDLIPQETLYWRRSIWEKIGRKLDETFLFAMDWDFLARLRDAGARFSRLPRFMGGFRIHPEQKTLSDAGNIGLQEMNDIRFRLLGRVPSEEEIFEAIRPYLIKHSFTDLTWRIRNVLGIPY